MTTVKRGIMATIHSFWALLASIVVWVGRTISPYIPERQKRIILIGSLFTSLQLQGLFPHVTIADLNERLKLTGDHAMFELPCMLSAELWSPDFLIELTTVYAQEEALSALIDRAVPGWVRYPRTTMLNDLKLMFTAEPAAQAA